MGVIDGEEQRKESQLSLHCSSAPILFSQEQVFSVQLCAANFWSEKIVDISKRFRQKFWIKAFLVLGNSRLNSVLLCHSLVPGSEFRLIHNIEVTVIWTLTL